MRLGFVLPNNWGIDDVAGVAGLAVDAEQAGLDSVWVNHHLLNVGYVGERLGARPYHDALGVLTWAAARTSRVRLGTSVLVISYLNPFVLAKAMATLDQLSGGRVVCGVGVGSLPEENDAVGVVAYGRRGRYADEFIGVLRTLWDDEAPAFSGEHFSFGPAPASPKPWGGRRLPVLVGGNRPPALRRAARLGDGWHALGLGADRVRARVATIDESLAEAGRSRDGFTVSVRLDVRPGTGAAAVADLAGAYAEAGVDELALSTGSPGLDDHRHLIAAMAGVPR